MDKKNNYKFLFIATEEDWIREIFKNEFGNKIKFLQYKKKINWNYNSNTFLGQNSLVIGNKEFTEIYILNIIILSKCLDIIGGLCNGLFGAFVISNGFRNKVLHLIFYLYYLINLHFMSHYNFIFIRLKHFL